MGRGGCLPYGENALVAITMYGGHNQEDSMIMNGGSLRRGMYQTMYYHSYDHAEEMLDLGLGTHTEIANPLKRDVKRKEGFDYELLDENGVVRVNSIVTPNTILLGMLAPITSPSGSVTYRDASVEPKRGQVGRVDAVYKYEILVPAGDKMKALKGYKIRIVEDRFPVVGDKMSSRHSQKGTVGEIMAEEDMPFTGSGLRPDLIMNPHAVPSRMTIAQLMECIFGKICVRKGTLGDGTPYSHLKVEELRAQMLELGMHPYGNEILYNGQTGEMMQAEIFMGPTFYQRLKHMVNDKAHSRSIGPMVNLTRQPAEGRSRDGGLRFGEMERDCMISHGSARFTRERTYDVSDKYQVHVCKKCGQIAAYNDNMHIHHCRMCDNRTDFTRVEIPYACKLLFQELNTMNIVPRIMT
jgi:DNA-directed RNA polymerase II subunit RPB2